MSSSVSNSRLKEAVKDRLQGSAYPSMRRLECEVYDGVLILSGRVPSFFEKQVAQETLAGLAGVKRIINCVEVN